MNEIETKRIKTSRKRIRVTDVPEYERQFELTEDKLDKMLPRILKDIKGFFGY